MWERGEWVREQQVRCYGVECSEGGRRCRHEVKEVARVRVIGGLLSPERILDFILNVTRSHGRILSRKETLFNLYFQRITPTS